VLSNPVLIDGFYVDRNLARQFVAVPLGLGHTAEEQLTSRGEWGGVQIAVYPLRVEVALEVLREREHWARTFGELKGMRSKMGLALGGMLDQRLFRDQYGVDAWDQAARQRCFVHLVPSSDWQGLTGQSPPPSPVTAREYRKAGLPFDPTYKHQRVARPGSASLASLRTFAQFATSVVQGERDQNEVAAEVFRHIGDTTRDPSKLN